MSSTLSGCLYDSQAQYSCLLNLRKIHTSQISTRYTKILSPNFKTESNININLCVWQYSYKPVFSKMKSGFVCLRRGTYFNLICFTEINYFDKNDFF